MVDIGVIGTGMIGAYHIERIAGQLAGGRVAAVYDADSGRARKVATAVGAVALDDAAELIASGRVDAVLVTSPGHTHAEFVLTALAAGKPVLTEKPLATSVGDCRAVMDAELVHGSRLVQVGFMRRFDRGYTELKAAIDAGTIGIPLLVHCVHRNAAVADAFTSDMSMTDSVIHEIDVVRWLLGEEIVAATVLAAKQSPLAAEHLQDPQLVVMEMKSGVLVDVEIFVNARYGYDVRCEVVGSEGIAELQAPVPVTITAEGARSRRVPPDWRERFDAAFHAELQQWIDGLEDGRTVGPSAWDGYAATAVADACVQAQESGQRTTVALIDRPPQYAV